MDDDAKRIESAARKLAAHHHLSLEAFDADYAGLAADFAPVEGDAAWELLEEVVTLLDVATYLAPPLGTLAQAFDSRVERPDTWAVLEEIDADQLPEAALSILEDAIVLAVEPDFGPFTEVDAVVLRTDDPVRVHLVTRETVRSYDDPAAVLDGLTAD